MKEKQEYMIPDNVRSDFEVVQHVTVKDLFCFVPALLIVIPVLLMPVSIYIKIPISTIFLIVSAVLVYLRPVRENIPFWQHARDFIRFSVRTKVYYYRKEDGWDEAEMAEAGGRGEAARIIRTAVNSDSGN